MRDHLRPLERRVLSMRDDGVSIDEIAGRLRRSSAHIERIISWTELPRSGTPSRQSAKAFERRVLALRRSGESYETIGTRFRRSPEFIRRVEGMAHYRRGVELLRRD